VKSMGWKISSNPFFF